MDDITETADSGEKSKSNKDETSDAKESPLMGTQQTSIYDSWSTSSGCSDKSHKEDTKVAASSTSSSKQSSKDRPAKRRNSIKKGQISSKKVVEGMPRRPLSAYNLFFKEQREHIIAERTQNLQEDYEASGRSGRRPKRAKIAFEELGRIIGARWKAIDPQNLARLKAKADADSRRYKHEMDLFFKKADMTRAEEKNQTFRSASSAIDLLPLSGNSRDSPAPAMLQKQASCPTLIFGQEQQTKLSALSGCFPNTAQGELPVSSSAVSSVAAFPVDFTPGLAPASFAPGDSSVPWPLQMFASFNQNIPSSSVQQGFFTEQSQQHNLIASQWVAHDALEQQSLHDTLMGQYHLQQQLLMQPQEQLFMNNVQQQQPNLSMLDAPSAMSNMFDLQPDPLPYQETTSNHPLTFHPSEGSGMVNESSMFSLLRSSNATGPASEALTASAAMDSNDDMSWMEPRHFAPNEEPAVAAAPLAFPQLGAMRSSFDAAFSPTDHFAHRRPAERQRNEIKEGAVSEFHVLTQSSGHHIGGQDEQRSNTRRDDADDQCFIN